jgi:hypothetical protein
MPAVTGFGRDGWAQPTWPQPPVLAPGQRAELQALMASLARLQAQIEALLASSQQPTPAMTAPVGLPAFLAPTPAAAPDALPAPVPGSPMPATPLPTVSPTPMAVAPEVPTSSPDAAPPVAPTLAPAAPLAPALPVPPPLAAPAPSQPDAALPSPTAPAPAPAPGPAAPTTRARGRQARRTANDVFAAARLDRSQAPKVSWYRPHRRNEAPTLRISGNVTSDNFWREVALASMNVGMSPRRMAAVLQTALPTALEGLGVRLDAAGRADLARTIRRETAGLPRANPIPAHLHPDTTGLYLDDNPAAVGWRVAAGQTFDRTLARN